MGSLPTELGLLSNLRTLDLSNNPDLTGMVPSELGRLDNLFTLSLHGTTLTGSVPDEICALKETQTAAEGMVSAPVSVQNVSATEVTPVSVQPATKTVEGENEASPNVVVGFVEVSSGAPATGGDDTDGEPSSTIVVYSTPSLRNGLQDIQIDCSRLICACNCTCA